MIHRILSTSDWHLRDVHLGRTDRAEDFTKAAHRIVDIAIEKKVTAIINGGDFTDSNRPSSNIIEASIPGIHARLKTAGIPMYGVNGDHDKTDPPWSARYNHDEGQGGIRMLVNQKVTIPGTTLTIYGLDFIGKTKERFLQIKDELPSANILLWHTMVKEFARFPGINAVSIDELPLDKYRYIALGDIHTRQFLRHADTGCWVGYPGNIELIKRDESIKKSVTLIDFDDEGKVTDLEEVFFQTRTARMLRIVTMKDMDAAVADLESIREENPIVFGRYNNMLPGVVSRIYGTLGENPLVRLSALPNIVRPLNQDIPIETSMKPSDFVADWLRPGTHIYDLGVAVLDKEAPVVDLVDAYISERLKMEET